MRSTGGSYGGGGGGGYSSGPDGGCVGCLVAFVIVGGIGIGAYKFFTREPPYQPPAVSVPVTGPSESVPDVADPDVSDNPAGDVGQATSSSEPDQEVIAKGAAIGKDARDKLTQSVGDLPEFRARFEEYAMSPTDSDADGFAALESRREAQRVLDNAFPAAERWLQWNAILDEWSIANLKEISHSDARDLAERTRALLVDDIAFNDVSLIRERLAALDAVSSRVNSDGVPIYLALTHDLRRREYHVPWVLATMNGDRYYLPRRPQLDDGDYVFEYLCDATQAARAESIPKSKINSSLSGASPNARVADQVLDLLSKLGKDNWESTFYKAIVTVNAEPELDPLIKVMWLQDILEVACQGSFPLSRSFSFHRDLLSGIQFENSVNPFDPHDDSAANARVQCQSTLDLLADMVDAGQRAAEHLNRITDFPTNARYVWGGWLHRNHEREWECVWKDEKIATESGLFIANRSAPGTPLYILPIGELSAGVTTFDDSVDSMMAEGLPVFIVERKTDAGGADAKF